MCEFDKIKDRKGTDCVKYDFLERYHKTEDVLPMWVADMDFAMPDAVIEKLKEVADHGIFGYTDTKEDYFSAVAAWFSHYHGWQVQEEWLVKTPGIVFAIGAAIRAYTKEGDGVLVQQPVYHPFVDMIEANGRRVVNNPLTERNGSYEMNFEDLEQKLKTEQVKLFLLCSPHNPVGRVWTEEELKRAGELCGHYGVPVLADEIHCDFTYGAKHHVFASLGESYAEQVLVCTSPGKTFNMAGLQVANIWIPNPQLRRAFEREMRRSGYNTLNTFGIAACKTAYATGGPWYEAMRSYVKENFQFLQAYLEAWTPEIHLTKPEGTYLAWLDCRELSMSPAELDYFMEQKAGLWLDGGTMFGEEGAGFQRMNLACSKEVVKKAAEQLRGAVEEWRRLPK